AIALPKPGAVPPPPPPAVAPHIPPVGPAPGAILAPKPAAVAPPAPPPAATGAATTEGAPPGGPPKDIRLKGDRLTVRVTGVPLDDVLSTIAEQTNAEIRGSVLAQRDVTTDFESVPVQEGLHRLLGDQNFLLTYREDGTLRTLALL